MFSKTLLLFLVVYCVFHYSYGQRDKKFFRKDYKYIESTEAFYKVHTLHKNWFEAKKQCAVEGASLFYPEDENEAGAAIYFWTNSHSIFEWVFVGISDLVAKGVFETTDGKPASYVYNNWAPGEPNNANNAEDCVILKKNGHLNDENCSNKYPYICKKSLQSLQWNPFCNIPNLDYRFNSTLGRCYKLHTKPLSWIDAYGLCAAEQSYLTVINSPAEAEFVVKLAEGIPVYPTAEPYLRGAIHSGFHSRLGEGWQTVQGTTLEESGYDCWDTKQPGGGDEEQCGSIFFNGRLNDINCNTKSIFVCEHDVDILSSQFDDRFGDGKPASYVYNNWAPGEPNNANNAEDCVILKKNGHLNDENCSNKYPYICKKSLQSLQWNPFCNIPNLDYRFNSTLGRCYKLHTKPLSWIDAYGLCAAEQSYLTVINSPAEAEFVVKLAEGIPVYPTAEPYLRGAIHSGFHSRLGEGWQTVQGTTLEESGYDCWDTKQPGGGDEEQCGSIFFNGRLNDINCNTKSIFVCEHDVDILSSQFDDRFGDGTVSY